jgi:hypothetical protein
MSASSWREYPGRKGTEISEVFGGEPRMLWLVRVRQELVKTEPKVIESC